MAGPNCFCISKGCPNDRLPGRNFCDPCALIHKASYNLGPVMTNSTMDEKIEAGLEQIEARQGIETTAQELKALRYNQDKLPLSLIPWEWLQALAEVLQAGARKYAANNWKLSLNTEDHEKFCYDRRESAKRHLLARDKGEVIDKETGCPHLALVAWNCLVEMWYDMNKKGV